MISKILLAFCFSIDSLWRVSDGFYFSRYYIFYEQIYPIRKKRTVTAIGMEPIAWGCCCYRKLLYQLQNPSCYSYKIFDNNFQFNKKYNIYFIIKLKWESNYKTQMISLRQMLPLKISSLNLNFMLLWTQASKHQKNCHGYLILHKNPFDIEHYLPHAGNYIPLPIKWKHGSLYIMFAVVSRSCLRTFCYLFHERTCNVDT